MIGWWKVIYNLDGPRKKKRRRRAGRDRPTAMPERGTVTSGPGFADTGDDLSTPPWEDHSNDIRRAEEQFGDVFEP